MCTRCQESVRGFELLCCFSSCPFLSLKRCVLPGSCATDLWAASVITVCVKYLKLRDSLTCQSSLTFILCSGRNDPFEIFISSGVDFFFFLNGSLFARHFLYWKSRNNRLFFVGSLLRMKPITRQMVTYEGHAFWVTGVAYSLLCQPQKYATNVGYLWATVQVCKRGWVAFFSGIMLPLLAAIL